MSETARLWDQWVVRHANLFGLISDLEIRMVVQWADFLQAQGYSVADANEASDELLKQGRPTYRYDHLSALLSLLRTIACRRVAREELERQAAAHAVAVCPDCGNTGLAVVPNMYYVSRNVWRTMAVVCKCAFGKQVQARHANRKPPTLEDYELLYDDWREIMRRHQQLLVEEARHLARAGNLDRSLGQLEKRIRRRFAQQAQQKDLPIRPVVPKPTTDGGQLTVVQSAANRQTQQPLFSTRQEGLAVSEKY